jgi:hypothetical protein
MRRRNLFLANRKAAASQIAEFTFAIWREAGAIVTSSLVVFIALGIWQYIFKHPISPLIYIAIMGGAVLIGTYRVYAREKKRRELAEAVAKPPVSSVDWRGLAANFEKLGNYLEADWQCNRRANQTVYENWAFKARSPAEQGEALCRYAGTLIAKSPNVQNKLSDNARLQTDPAWRWLYFLKENYGRSNITAATRRLTQKEPFI